MTETKTETIGKLEAIKCVTFLKNFSLLDAKKFYKEAGHSLNSMDVQIHTVAKEIIRGISEVFPNL
ncbi:MAG: hypothetical protein KJI71_04465 [Patescibacteria group bacterium]|nr:hypothetical protein [Patescibacteria group bacterium]